MRAHHRIGSQALQLTPHRSVELRRGTLLASKTGCSAEPGQFGGVGEVMRLTRVLLTVAFFGAFSAIASAEVNEESLSCGCSGGFTGGGGGVVVQRDGGIHRWSRPTYRDPVEQSFVRFDRVAARDLFAQVERIKFTSIRYSKPSNMTCRVELRQGASTHVIAWPLGDPAAPSEVVALASRMEQIARVQPVEPK